MVAPYVFLQQGGNIDVPHGFRGRIVHGAHRSDVRFTPPRRRRVHHERRLREHGEPLRVAPLAPGERRERVVPVRVLGDASAARRELREHRQRDPRQPRAARAGQNDDVVVAASLTGGKTAVQVLTAVTAAGATAFATSGAEADLGFDLSGISDGEAQILAASVTGSAANDVVLASPSSGLMVVPWDGTALGAPTSLSVSQLYAPCGSSASATTDTIRVAALPSSGGNQTLVVALSSAILLVEQQGGALVVTCLSQDADGDVQPLADGGTSDAGSSQAVPMGGSAVAVGDFNGDGIQDIVVSQGQGLIVYYGDALCRAASRPSRARRWTEEPNETTLDPGRRASDSPRARSRRRAGRDRGRRRDGAGKGAVQRRRPGLRGGAVPDGDPGVHGGVQALAAPGHPVLDGPGAPEAILRRPAARPDPRGDQALPRTTSARWSRAAGAATRCRRSPSSSRSPRSSGPTRGRPPRPRRPGRRPC